MSEQTNYDRLTRGERVVMSEDQMNSLIDQFCHEDNMIEIASCLNRNRVGILDQYVVWIGEQNKPTDLEYGNPDAFGSV